jgi:hypothetical protein
MKRFSSIFFLCLGLFPFTLYALKNGQISCNEGNFSLPPSQQPSSLVAFGENIIEEGQAQAYLSSSASIGKKQNYVPLSSTILYGIRDDLSVLLDVPIVLANRSGKDHSSGLGDVILQFEYALFANSGDCYSNQWTVVANASFPTGSEKQHPPIGFGAMGYFIGTTYLRLEKNWGCFTSYGVHIPASSNGTKYGTQYVYQWGGEWVFTSSKSVIFAGMLEVDGVFQERNKIKGIKSSDSGGNFIYVTPSIFVSSKTWILQIGYGFTVQSHLFGNQNKNKYFPSFQLRKTF